MLTHTEFIARAKLIKMIILDNDGVFTDGNVYINIKGEEAKSFFIRDGFAVIMARRLGLEFGIITGLLSPIVEYRAAQLGITEVHKGFMDKVQQLEDILSRRRLDPIEAAYMGDDLFDIPVMRKVGLSAAPADAYPAVRTAADWVSTYPGGRGCVREFVELILDAQGKWDAVVQEFTGNEDFFGYFGRNEQQDKTE